MPLILDETGRPVKGYDVIYPPGSQAWEYAPLATNPYKGCGHACKYCYVPLATHQKRAEFNEGAVYREGFLERLRKDARRFSDAGVRDQVLLCFSTDPYHPGNVEPTREALGILIEHGMAFCALTKGGMKAARDIDLFRPGRDAFAVTMTSLDAVFSRMWEPNAVLPYERIEALLAFRRAGIFTWISLEPTLSAAHSLAVVDETHEFVDLYKVGKANYLGEFAKAIDWRDYTLRMIEKLQALGKAHYIKKDLHEFLPPGYHNPLRVQQHH